jgi:uncharacterized protein
MKSFACVSCGDCCGPVPVTANEFNRIKVKLSRMPSTQYNRLMNQTRDELTCMFRDVEKNRCGIYSVRPEICRMFGYYEGMACHQNGNEVFATKTEREGRENILSKFKGQSPIGILTLEIKWDRFR